MIVRSLSVLETEQDIGQDKRAMPNWITCINSVRHTYKYNMEDFLPPIPYLLSQWDKSRQLMKLPNVEKTRKSLNHGLQSKLRRIQSPHPARFGLTRCTMDFARFSFWWIVSDGQRTGFNGSGKTILPSGPAYPLCSARGFNRRLHPLWDVSGLTPLFGRLYIGKRFEC